MKNLSILFIFIFSFFHVFLFPYQPTPYNLFTGELDRKGEGDILSKIQMNQQKTNIFFEKGENGSDSKVFNVNNLSQFLNLSKNNLKPIIVKIFLKDDGNKFIYQGLADKFSKQALFISVNAITGEQFVKMFIFLLNVGGINLSLANDKYPIFLFCDSDFIIFQQNTIGFKKYGLTLLNTPGIFDEKQLASLIENKLNKDKQVQEQQIESQVQPVDNTTTFTNVLNSAEKQREKQDQKKQSGSFFENIKNWIKSKI